MASSVFQSKGYACAMLYNKLPSILAPQATLAPPSSIIELRNISHQNVTCSLEEVMKLEEEKRSLVNAKI